MKILIPAYEPKDKLITLIDDIQKITDTPIIVVNDGSGEEYKKIFDQVEKKGVKVLNHEKNKGKGEAIKTGIKYLMEIGEEEGVVSADCDGQHSPKDIVKVIEELKKSKNDLVLGVRNFNQKGIPFRSKFGNIISKITFLAMTGNKVTDTQTGLRGYSKNIFEWLISIDGSRYEYEFNVLLGIKEKGLTYSEISIETIYEDKNAVSHFRPIRDSILIYKPVCKFVISSVLAIIIDTILLLVFQNIFNELLIAVILSRAISSIINFICNKNFVFENKEKGNLFKLLIKYYALVVVILVLNYLILNFLYEILGINLLISKIITEVILYSFSFIIQRRVVFKKNVK